jgi:hypothetical protein
MDGFGGRSELPGTNWIARMKGLLLDTIVSMGGEDVSILQEHHSPAWDVCNACVRLQFGPQSERTHLPGLIHRSKYEILS